MLNLDVSHNCGLTYSRERQADSLEELRPRLEQLDDLRLRWSVVNDDGELVCACAIHRRIVAWMDALNVEIVSLDSVVTEVD